MPSTTTKYSIPYCNGSDDANTIDNTMTLLAEAIDSIIATDSQGLLVAIPPAGKLGRYYWATDTQQLLRDDGSTWTDIQLKDTNKRSGKSIINTEEVRTNVAYGLMTTPDQVTGIVVEQDGHLVVNYQALAKTSVVNAGAVEIIINSFPMEYMSDLGAPAVIANAYYPDANGAGFGQIANDYDWLFTNPQVAGGFGEPLGMYTNNIVSTGQATDRVTGHALLGGQDIKLDVDPGVHTVSVQYKSTSGSVTVKNRKLRVKSISY